MEKYGSCEPISASTSEIIIHHRNLYHKQHPWMLDACLVLTEIAFPSPKFFHIICKEFVHETFSAIIVEKFVSGDAISVNTRIRDRGAVMDFMFLMSMMVSLLLTYITSPDRYFSTIIARKASLTRPSWQRRRRAPL